MGRTGEEAEAGPDLAGGGPGAQPLAKDCPALSLPLPPKKNPG